MNIRSHFGRRLLIATALGAAYALAAAGQPMAPVTTERGDGGDDAECADGVVVDDGSAETGYGWVPSVTVGEYVQEFDDADFSSRRLDSVCICWLRTRPDATIDFEIVFFHQITDPENPERLIPASEPYKVLPASAEVEPKGITESFFEVDVTGAVIPFGRSYIGARWDASRDQFFFICADHSDDTPPVEVFFRDNRADGWTSVFETTDPIFDDHKAIMVRARPGPVETVDVPALEPAGLTLLAAALAALAVAMLARRRRSRG